MPTQKLQSKPRSWEARQKLISAIRERKDFTTSGSLRGEATNYAASHGRLYSEQLFDSEHTGNLRYVVYSYATPIAWYDARLGWIVPDVTYSVTTGSQQSIVRQAVGAVAFDLHKR